MGDVNGRLRRLEERLPERGRCTVCREWAGGHVRYVNGPRGCDGAEEAGPRRRPACGWEQATFTIEYVDAGRSA